MNRFLQRLCCATVGHEPVYASDAECHRERWSTYMFRPFTCARCGHESPRFKIPEAPPMPNGGAAAGCKRQKERRMNMAQEIRPGMSELIGRRCECEFAGRSGAVVVIVDAIDMPMMKLRYAEGVGNPFWINVSQIMTLLNLTESAPWTTT